MDIRKYKEFAVVGLSSTHVRGCVFRNRKTHFELFSHASAVLDKVDPASAWKEVFRLLSVSGDCPLFLCGALEGGYFFQTRMLALAPKAMREALSLELSQHLLGEVEEGQFQFASFPQNSSGSDNGEVGVNVYSVPGRSLEKLAAMLTQCGRKADEFFFPHLALTEKDPPLYLPEAEEKYCFANGAWQQCNPDSMPDAMEEWKKIFEESFKIIPEDLVIRDFMAQLLVARLVLSPTFPTGEEGFRLLPETLRTKRLRAQLKVTAILLILVLLNACWSFSGDWLKDFRTHRALTKEKAALSEEYRSLRSRIRKEEKETKERQRLVNLKAGEHDIVGKIADITNLLPNNVLVSSLRWSDSGVDILMFSEAEDVSISELVRRGLKYWKITNIQQRNFGGASTMINLRLTDAGTEEKK